jgi:hygromycin-B 7''-O-kinase
MPLPAFDDYPAFDDFHDDPGAWRDEIAEIAAAHSRAPIRLADSGTVLVALVGDELVVKLYPSFLADHAAFERAALRATAGRLGIPTPALIADGERDGWPYLVMTQLHGEPMTAAWPRLDEPRKHEVLEQLGGVIARAHALPVGDVAPHAPAWDAFLSAQRAGCHARHARTELPPHLLADLDRFLAGPVPDGPHVLLTGEYTPMNLLVDDRGLCGMYDFGDGLVGPARYDWLGPLVFLAAGDRARRDALMRGIGARLDDDDRAPQLRLMLLHRYSNLRAQLVLDGWRDARDLDDLARRLWP